MDPTLSHALTALVSASVPLLGAVTYFVRNRGKNESRIAAAVAKGIEGHQKDLEQAREWAQEALSIAREERKGREASNARHLDCEKRCDALHKEITDLRNEVRSGHARSGR